MGNKEAKMKKAFEAIDVSGDKKVTKAELCTYLETERAKKLLKRFTDAEYQEFQQEVKNLGKSNF